MEKLFPLEEWKKRSAENIWMRWNPDCWKKSLKEYNYPEDCTLTFTWATQPLQNNPTVFQRTSQTLYSAIGVFLNTKLKMYNVNQIIVATGAFILLYYILYVCSKM